MDFSIASILQAFEQSLPGDESHRAVISHARPSVAQAMSRVTNPRQSAVVFLLFPRANQWHFVLLKRHDYRGVHSGQVGLPGGSLDPGETAEQAALRELSEETGLMLSEEYIIKPLSQLYIPPSNFIVQPYAAIVTETPIWSFDDYEVKRGIEVPLVELLEPNSLEVVDNSSVAAQTKVIGKGFVFGGEIVWGATAMILNECKQILRILAT